MGASRGVMKSFDIIEGLALIYPFVEGECFFCDMPVEFSKEEGHNYGCIWAEAVEWIQVNDR